MAGPLKGTALKSTVIANPDKVGIWQSRLKLLRLPRHPRQGRGAPRNDRLNLLAPLGPAQL